MFEDFLANDVKNHPKEIHCDEVPKYSDCYGEYLFEKTQNYLGNFKNGLFHGKGTFRGTGDYEYIGQFKNGKLDGKGEIKYADGNGSFKGIFKNDKTIYFRLVKSSYVIKNTRSTSITYIFREGDDGFL